MTKKIDYFKNHKEYPWLREYADGAKRDIQTIGVNQIRANNFIDRIVAMPLDYIEEYPDYEICKISKRWVNFYKNCGYKVLKEENNSVFVGKRQ